MANVHIEFFSKEEPRTVIDATSYFPEKEQGAQQPHILVIETATQRFYYPWINVERYWEDLPRKKQMAVSKCTHTEVDGVVVGKEHGVPFKLCRVCEVKEWDYSFVGNPYNNASYCAFCTVEFNKNEVTVMYLGEYRVHERCKEGYVQQPVS